MGDLIDTTEMYLKTILEMEEDGVTPLRARIVERLGHSGPTVSQTVARMERDGLLHVMGDRRLDLTEEGRRLATDVLRKHRLAERLLLDVIGLDWALVHEEACRWEHVMSDRVETRLVDLLETTDVDPYGNPVPGAGLERRGESVEIAVRTPDDLIMRIVRIGEPIQAEEGLIASFAELGLVPGARVGLSVHGDVVRISAIDEAGAVSGYVTIPVALSPHLFVEKE
ncbi:metal-dependent transcriptional regulator [Actinomyces sp. B33]|uniref:metal-dependent transcriptional regulator n=1 Tax=Actinomyces sp. B33 TaxID=2942131 RepID=UPI00234183A1|nr:metal-dependent transcriptional regulator [Actinomyces sp. B33]MDC4232197.1 metal-dependent transcriptional regulator [Actinomyces sp. B33]